MGVQYTASHAAGDIAKQYFQWKFPVDRVVTYTPEQWQRAERWHRLRNIVTVVVVMIYLLAAPVGFAWLLQYPYQLLYKLIARSGEVFFPVEWLFHVLPGFCLMLCTISLFLNAFQRITIGQDYEVFAYYYDLKQGYDNRKAGAWIQKLMVLPLILALLYTFSTHIIVKDDGISYKGLDRILPDKFLYSDIISIRYVVAMESEDRHIQEAGIYSIIIPGDDLRTGFYFGEDKDGAARFINMVVDRSGKTIEQLPLMKWEER
jgi:hypothetical protein